MGLEQAHPEGEGGSEEARLMDIPFSFSFLAGQSPWEEQVCPRTGHPPHRHSRRPQTGPFSLFPF